MTTLWCSACLATHEMLRAVTVAGGEALCVRHFAQVAAPRNPAMSVADVQDMIERTLQKPDRADELGRPLPT